MWAAGSRQAAVSLAEFSDTSAFSPCKRCSELLQEGDRFCRFCGEDQSGGNAADDASPALGPARGRRGTQRPIEVDFADTLQPEEQGAAGVLVLTSAANEAVHPEMALDRVVVLGSKAPPRGGRAGHSAGRPFTAYRLVIGIVTLAVLLAFAMDYLDKQKEPGKRQDYRANADQTGGAPSGTKRTLDLVAADRRNDLGEQKSREASDRQVPLREQEEQRGEAAKPDQRQDAALEVFKALGLGEPLASPAEAPISPATPVVIARPASEVGVANPIREACSEVLAALAVCMKE
ncbi:hypothetical protein QTH97_33935 [Variovorax sp. J22R24]|uniref:hypothetical protein n=1 Tax=Variovorax gracilis TaxID=3053502 RepID=UPI002577855E|nr:hypothetical protein [Variovorax sp. J22R24]MDM0109952.1 hypothetical protein [Variovorax sp. J22R24]